MCQLRVFEVAVAVLGHCSHLQSKNRSLEGIVCLGVEPDSVPKVFCFLNHLASFDQGTVCS